MYERNASHIARRVRGIFPNMDQVGTTYMRRGTVENEYKIRSLGTHVVSTPTLICRQHGTLRFSLAMPREMSSAPSATHALTIYTKRLPRAQSNASVSPSRCHGYTFHVTGNSLAAVSCASKLQSCMRLYKRSSRLGRGAGSASRPRRTAVCSGICLPPSHVVVTSFATMRRHSGSVWCRSERIYWHGE